MDADAEKDLAAIAELHRRDMGASRACDFETLRTLMSEGAVIMQPGGGFVRGRAAVGAASTVRARRLTPGVSSFR